MARSKARLKGPASVRQAALPRIRCSRRRRRPRGRWRSRRRRRPRRRSRWRPRKRWRSRRRRRWRPRRRWRRWRGRRRRRGRCRRWRRGCNAADARWHGARRLGPRWRRRGGGDVGGDRRRDRVDFDVADLGRVVAVAPAGTVRIDVDDVGPVQADRRGGFPGQRIGLERRRRHQLAHGRERDALQAVHLGLAAAFAGFRIDAGAVARTQCVAGDPDERVRPIGIQRPVVDVSEAEIDAAGRVRPDIAQLKRFESIFRIIGRYSRTEGAGLLGFLALIC